MDKERFKELYQLAHGGDMNAKADLWLEFEFAFDHDPLPAFMNPPPIVVAGVGDPGSGGTSASVTKRTTGVSPAPNNHQPPTNNLNAKGGAPC